jgi:hypothetical protein
VTNIEKDDSKSKLCDALELLLGTSDIAKLKELKCSIDSTPSILFRPGLAWVRTTDKDRADASKAIQILVGILENIIREE